MRLLVTGGTGFVGTHLVRKLVDEGHTIRVLSHRSTLPKDLATLETVTLVSGDVLEPASLAAALPGSEAVIHLVGIIREFPARGITFEKMHHEATRNVVAATSAAGIRRYLHMSALGTRPNAVSGYHQTKWAAEEVVRASPLAWTIFRPSLIYGPGDGFVSTMVPLAKGPLFPVIGGGQTHAAPVAVHDVVAGYARALALPESIGQSYDVAGPEEFTYREIYRIIATALGRPFRPITIPYWMVSPVASLLQYQPWFPLTQTQLQMLKEDNTGDPATFPDTFGIEMTHFEEGLGYLKH